jgi:quercetin dioxygenase-like cupin family protein
MTVLPATAAPRYELGGVTFTGLAAPSRGSSENAVWRIRIPTADPGRPHRLDHEEIIVALAGRAVATLDGEEHDVNTGDTVIVRAGTAFALRAADGDGFEGLAILAAGATACFPGGEPFTPPWCA